MTTPAKGANYAILQATLLAPRSRGSVNIQSADMSVAPVIDPNWLSEQTDVEVLTAGVKRVRQALNSTAMAPVLIGDEILPGVDVQTDDDIAAYLAKVGNPIYHAFASNKMGRTSDPDAVVDSRGRVIGVSNCKSSFLEMYLDTEVFEPILTNVQCESLILLRSHSCHQDPRPRPKFVSSLVPHASLPIFTANPCRSVGREACRRYQEDCLLVKCLVMIVAAIFFRLGFSLLLCSITFSVFNVAFTELMTNMVSFVA